MPDTTANHHHVPGMDGLRAVAALWVFGVHFNQMADLEFLAGPFDLALFLANGAHGVALFFLLSGFLLSLKFWKAELSKHPIPPFPTYIARRLARIIPAYFFLLSALVFTTQYWKIPGSGPDILFHYLFIFNFTEFSIFSISPPFWSLAVELQFYFLLPFLFFSFKFKWIARNVGKTMAIFTIIVCFLQFTLLKITDSVIPWPLSPWLTWIRPYGAVLNHSLVATMPHFMVGIASGYIYEKFYSSHHYLSFLKTNSEPFFWTSTVFILLLLSTGWIEVVEFSLIPYGFPMVPLLFAVIVLTVPFSVWAKSILESSGIKFLGTISYGIYLYHYPCLYYVEQYFQFIGRDVRSDWILFGLAGQSCTLIAATLSFYFIEKPFSRIVGRK